MDRLHSNYINSWYNVTTRVPLQRGFMNNIEEEYGGELDFARKHRPEKLEDYIGNDDIREVLFTRLKNGYPPKKVSITGFTGSGKTTLGRIIVKEYLCPNRDPILGACDDENCEYCPYTSFYVKTGNFENLPDVRELDLGQSGGKDVSTELKEWISYPPEDPDSSKILLIDEAHNGTRAFWEGNLKWIEDPPAYLVIILATTDPEKIPGTVLNRFNENFEVKRPLESELVAHLATVCGIEGVQYDVEALRIISRSANRVIRAALHKLESAYRTYGNVYTDNVVKQENAFKDEQLKAFLKSLNDKDYLGYFHVIHTIAESSHLTKFVRSVIDYTLRGIYIKNGVMVDSLSKKEIDEYRKFFGEFEPQTIALLLSDLKDALTGDTELKLASMIYKPEAQVYQGTAGTGELATPSAEALSSSSTEEFLARTKAIKKKDKNRIDRGMELLERESQPVTVNDVKDLFNPTRVE